MKYYNSIQVKKQDESLDDVFPRTSSTNPHPHDHLTPCFDSSREDRPSNILIGTFNLIASIVGAGVLSLPMVFSKCGIFFTTISMGISAHITYLSLTMLCYSSRRRGGSSYGEVMRSAFGEKMEEAVSFLLFIFLMFVIMGYMVIIRDIWTPIVMLTPFASTLGANNGDYVLLGIIVLLLPFLFQRSLHALRYNCYIGFVSVLILCFALYRGALHRIHGAELDQSIYDSSSFEIDFFKVPTIQEVLFSFPIVTCSFLCHFNVNSIQNALYEPTRQRIQQILRYSIAVSFLVMYLLGLGGYLYAGAAVEGNILLNVPIGKNKDDADSEQMWLFIAGRVGFGLVIILALPLMTLPCRDSLLEIIDVWLHRSRHQSSALLQSNLKDKICCWNLFDQCSKSEILHDVVITTEVEIFEERLTATDETRLLPRRSIIKRHDAIQKDCIFRNVFVHYGTTLLIITVCYYGAVIVRGVAYVWSFIGSSMAFVIAFILPCRSFIVIENQIPTAQDGGDREESWVKIAWVIFTFATIGTVTCTMNTLF